VELIARLNETETREQAASVRYRSALLDRSPEARLTVPVLAKYVAGAKEEIAALREKVSQLTLRAPHDGVLRTPSPQLLLGQYFQARQTVFELGDTSSSRLIIPLDEKQVRRVQVGQAVSVRFDAAPEVRVLGTISAVPIAPTEEISVPALANIHGGDIPAQPNPSTNEPKASIPHYEAQAVLTIPPEVAKRLRAHSLGRAKIEISSTKLGPFLWERLWDTIDPGIRL